MSENGDFEAGFLASMEFLEDNLRQAEDSERQASTAMQGLSQLSSERWSYGRELSVTLDHTGIVSDVHFTDRAMRLSPGQLSRMILRTAGDAAKDLATAANTLADEFDSTGTSLAQEIRRTYSRGLAGLIALADPEVSKQGPARPWS